MHNIRELNLSAARETNNLHFAVQKCTGENEGGQKIPIKASPLRQFETIKRGQCAIRAGSETFQANFANDEIRKSADIGV